MQRTMLLILGLLINTLSAVTLEVPENYSSIQAAIDTAATGDSILVSSGTYVENLDFLGKEIMVRSLEGPDSTVIDGHQNGSCVLMRNGETQNTILDGFTLTNGSGTLGQNAWIGGGLVVQNYSHPILKNLIVTGNACTNGTGPAGGGVSIGDNSNPYLEGIIISDNVSEWGGGISIYDCSPTLYNVTISANHATSGGGGVYIGREANPELCSVQIFDNTATLSAGGLFVHLDSAPLLNQLTVVNNVGPYGGGGLLSSANCSLVITNSIFWGNVPDQLYMYNDATDLPGTLSVNFSNVMGGPLGIHLGESTMQWGRSNMDIDPCFCDPDADVFTLPSGSPCLGAGSEGLNIGALGEGCEFPVFLDDEFPGPDALALYQNFPNPFNPTTTISYDLPGAGWVSLVIYDLLGREVATLANGTQSSGYHSVDWNSVDTQGNPLDAGIYLYRIKFSSANGTEHGCVQKLSLLK